MSASRGKPAPVPTAATGPGFLGRLADLVAVLVLGYLLCGMLLTIGLAFLGGGRIGAAAFNQAGTYLTCCLWPYTLWVLLTSLAGVP
jgi:hypothetical protein